MNTIGTYISDNIITFKKPKMFREQKVRKDVLYNMLKHTHLSGKTLYDLLMKENKKNTDEDERRFGWIYETICQILVVMKCIDGLHYTEILDGQLQILKPLKNINNILKIKVDGGGNNIVDMVIKQDTTFILFSIKYNKKYSETDVCKIDTTITKQNITTDYKIGLIVKNKDVVKDHNFKNKKNIDKELHDTIIQNNLIFDETDIIRGLDVFCHRFSTNKMDLDVFVEYINTEYLFSPREQLTLKLHQKMTLMKFMNDFVKNKHRFWCIAHKPRSGKSITMLSISKFLLDSGLNKILIMTSVPATINSFVNDLDTYIDFSKIQYKLQDEFDTIDSNFKGIVFCSVQYLKMDGKSKKSNMLKQIGFDFIITDESHQGSSTDKTRKDILEIEEIDTVVEDIRKTIRYTIFASGTPDKTCKYYGIHPSCVYEWEIEDEAYMKKLTNFSSLNKDEIMGFMVRRHGDLFNNCFVDETLNKDYSKYPTQVLMKHSIPDNLVNDINVYNSKNNANFGYSASSLFALRQFKDAESGEIKYAEEFELCKDNDGLDIIKGFLDSIISKNKMNKGTIMKHIENLQSARGSRISTVDNPLLFLVFLPTHTRNNTISLLQKTLKQFLETNNLWSDYNIEYSNSLEDTGNVKEEYNEYINTIL